jgi:hypothetical protein
MPGINKSSLRHEIVRIPWPLFQAFGTPESLYNIPRIKENVGQNQFGL